MIKLQKTLTREIPLPMINSFLKDYFNIGKILNLKMPPTFSLFDQGTWISYRDNHALHLIIPQKLSKWTGKEKNKKQLHNLCKLTAEIVGSYLRIQKFLSENKQISLGKLLDYSTKIQALFIRGFPGLFIATWLPLWQDDFHKNKNIYLFNKKLANDIKTLRRGPIDKFFNLAMDLAFLALKMIAQNKNWSLSLIKYLTGQELLKFISKKNLSPEILRILNKRKNEKFGYSNKIIYKENLKKELKKLNLELEEEKIGAVKEIMGTTANIGKTKGITKIIFSREQLNKIKEGDILVAPMTTPWYLPALKKSVCHNH